ncbi:MAG TPA: hypothetical protein VG963_09700, partial [Polyangiaceae bacterium]|nr:hypothetical protein [Polyangiaceae bacterium]
GNASARLIAQVIDKNVTVFISLRTPITDGDLTLASGDAAIIWAKQGSGNPLVATTGTITTVRSADHFQLELRDVAKQETDSFGGSFVANGAITELTDP